MAITPGSHFAGRFVVERLLGQGGMGIVFAARHSELDELVAVKVMLPEVAANAEAAARFQREARASVRIKSDYIVRVLDVSRLEDGTPYMVMEYLDGENLDEHLSKHRPIAIETAARYLIEACDAIAAAHAIGIVHRDLKPQNLFLAKQGDETNRIKVLDFGISKVSEKLSSSEAALTRTSSLMGSPLYMSPEQMQSARTVDHRADIWALGCVLFELLTDTPPFNGGSIPELCAAVLTKQPPLASTLRSDLPKAIDAIISRCLEKTPDARYSTVAQLALDLLAFAPDATAIVAGISRRQSSLPPPMSAPVPGIETIKCVPTVTQVNWGHATRPPSRRISVLGLWSVVGILGLTAIGWVFWVALRHGKVAATPSNASPTLAATAPNEGRSAVGANLPPVVGFSKDPQVHPPLQTADVSDKSKEKAPSMSAEPTQLSSPRRPKSASVPQRANALNVVSATPTAARPKPETIGASAQSATPRSLNIDIK